ncbi:MAG: argininosuccinate lyase [Phycisphaerae bacterium]
MADVKPRRLWDKGAALDELIHRFTVGDDPQWDRLLVAADCAGSAAHARTLHRAKLLSDAELAALLAALRDVATDAARDSFAIPPELEDCHTAIEARLIDRCGDAGAKVHTGRSRNDQVATAMRLYLRGALLDRLVRLGEFTTTTLARIERDGAHAMPGYTHMQPAMPSSVGQWLHAVVEAALEHVRAGLALYERLDACPLGTGAGFGVPVALDRAFTAKLLGFSRVQRSAIDVQNSRGRYERDFARWAADAGALVEKLACDLMLFTTVEFGFFRLPESLTTGSSIMPQKRNPDVLELLRGRAARLRARAVELDWIIGKLPSSYHRDWQLTKEPAFRAAADVLDLLAVAERVIELVEIDAARMAAAMRPELYATLAALRATQGGTPFRQAYRQVADALRAGTFAPPTPSTDDATPEIVSAELLAELRAEHEAAMQRVEVLRAHVRDCEAHVLAAEA